MPDEQAPQLRRLKIALWAMVALVVSFGLMFGFVAYAFRNI